MKEKIMNNKFGEWLMKIECMILLTSFVSVFTMDLIQADHTTPPIQTQISTSTTQKPCTSTPSTDTSIIKQKVIGSTSTEKGHTVAELKTVKIKGVEKVDHKLIKKLYEYLLDDSDVDDRIEKMFTSAKDSEKDAHKKVMNLIRQFEHYKPGLISLLKREFPKNDAEEAYGTFLGDLYSSAGDWINNKKNPTDFIRCIINASWIGDKYYPDVNEWGIYIHTLGGWSYVEMYMAQDSTDTQKNKAIKELKAIIG